MYGELSHKHVRPAHLQADDGNHIYRMQAARFAALYPPHASKSGGGRSTPNA